MARTKDTSTPWKFLDDYRGEFFSGEWPTLPEMFNIIVKRYPDNRCLTVFSPQKMEMTYAETQSAVLEVSSYLVKKGVKKGDRVAVTGKNSPEWTIAYLAVLYAGGVVVPLDFQLTPEEIDGLMKFSDVKILFVDQEKMDAVGKKVELEEKISLEPGGKNYILDKREKKFADRTMAEENDLAAILYTSGTTGTPKGVMLTHANLVSDCYLVQARMNVYPTDVFYALLPIHHSYTMLAVFIESISVGAELVFGKKLVIKQIFKDLQEGHITMFLGVPMLFNKLIKGVMNGIRGKERRPSCRYGQEQP